MELVWALGGAFLNAVSHARGQTNLCSSTWWGRWSACRPPLALTQPEGSPEGVYKDRAEQTQEFHHEHGQHSVAIIPPPKGAQG